MTSNLMADGAKALCCALPAEIQLYQAFITAAVNLPSSAVRETLEALHQTCRGGATAILPKSQRQLVGWDWTEWQRRECQRPTA